MTAVIEVGASKIDNLSLSIMSNNIRTHNTTMEVMVSYSLTPVVETCLIRLRLLKMPTQTLLTLLLLRMKVLIKALARGW